MYPVGRVGMKQNKVIGLTGGISSGKSLVTAYLREKGYPVLDSDEIAKDLQRDPMVLKGLNELFPGSVKEGKLDRDQVGQLVFSNKEARAKLDAFMHPLVFSVLSRQVKELSGLVFIDMPLMIETLKDQGDLSYDEIWLVWVPREIQISRLMKRDGISRDYAIRKIDAQLPLEEKKSYASLVIDNSQGPEETLKQVEEELKRLCENTY